MTTGKALYSFFSGFGIPAYASTAVPDNASMPYITYTGYDGYFGDYPVSITADVWYYDTSEAAPNAKVKEIAAAIGAGGVQIPCDNGTIWISRGTPWAQPVPDVNNAIKRRTLNITAVFNVID